MAFTEYFDARANKFAALYDSRLRAVIIGRRALFDRVDFAVRTAEALGASRVLDVGCGSGVVFAPMAATGIHVTGIEPAPRMAALARVAAARHPSLTEVIDMSWEALPSRAWPEFDLVIALGVFDYVDVPDALISALAGKGGHVVASFPRACTRTRLRRRRYARHGVSVFGYRASEIHALCVRNGLVVRTLTRLGRAGFVLHATRNDDARR
jgi:2-polyprenyl-3-methyl-5-hydroxy-6-metoxy-1,4-benzoquinol methylase